MERKCYVDEDFCLDEKGIIREKTIYSETQAQTMNSFSYKWNKKDTYASKEVNYEFREWLLQKYFDNDESFLDTVFSDGSVVIDAGCGAGMAAMNLLGDRIKRIHYIGVDISTAIDVAYDNFNSKDYLFNSEFVQCDLNHIPIKEKVDVIFSEGVLHHTDSTRNAIINLSKLLRLGGYFCFYVYAKKAPIREFTDDFIRNYFKDKSNDETWEELRSLTKLGKMLGDLNIKLNIEEAIPFLGIKQGEIDLQRFFYWYVFKCFYKSEYDIEEMNHINFDWYRPENCHRQTPEEVSVWCEEAG